MCSGCVAQGRSKHLPMSGETTMTRRRLKTAAGRLRAGEGRSQTLLRAVRCRSYCRVYCLCSRTCNTDSCLRQSASAQSSPCLQWGRQYAQHSVFCAAVMQGRPPALLSAPRWCAPFSAAWTACSCVPLKASKPARGMVRRVKALSWRWQGLLCGPL